MHVRSVVRKRNNEPETYTSPDSYTACVEDSQRDFNKRAVYDTQRVNQNSLA